MEWVICSREQIYKKMYFKYKKISYKTSFIKFNPVSLDLWHFDLLEIVWFADCFDWNLVKKKAPPIPRRGLILMSRIW